MEEFKKAQEYLIKYSSMLSADKDRPFYTQFASGMKVEEQRNINILIGLKSPFEDEI